MLNFFIEGGIFWTSLLTIELIALFLAAWKAPAWTKEAGLIGLMTGLIGTLIGISQMCSAIHQVGPMSMTIVAGGLKVALITVIYGCLIYLISLILRIVQKPRI